VYDDVSNFKSFRCSSGSSFSGVASSSGSKENTGSPGILVSGSRLPGLLATADNDRIMQELAKAQVLATQLSSGLGMEVDEPIITCLLNEAFHENDQRFSEASALLWANSFKFPYDVYTRDLNDFLRLNKDLPSLVRLRQDVTRDERLNVARVQNLGIADSEWKARLLAMASGIPILTAPDFSPTNIPPKLRQKYLRLSPAINKSIYELYKNNLVIILPTTVAKEISGIHFSAIHWTLQADKEQGRTLADPSSGDNPLNSLNAKAVIDSVCGRIVHPTIEDMMRMLITFIGKNESFEDIILWKRDMAGAFTLLNILPEYVRLCAYELTDGLTMFYISGFFGHCSLPSFFNVVTRVAESEIRARIHGAVCMYVDDVCGVSRKEFLENDMELSKHVITSLTGPRSIALHKDRIGRCIDWIGWGIDLDLKMVNVSRKNLLKCLHGFFSVDLESNVSIKMIERWASWCSRYSIILPVLKPLTLILHGEHAGMVNRLVSKRLSVEAKLVCWIWRAFFILIAIKPEHFARPILSFKTFSSLFRVEYDASLAGLGLIISRLDGEDWKTFKVLAVKVPYLLRGDSSFQNTMEFMAVALAVCILRTLGYRDFGLDLIGDNMSSLSWAKYNRFKKGRSLRVVLLFMQVTILSGIRVNLAEHLSGEYNILCDALSRGTRAEELGYSDDLIISPMKCLWFDRFFHICNPLLETLTSESEFVDFWTDLTAFCISL